MEMFNAVQFQDLLRKAIGTRTQKEFSKDTGIAEATITKMLGRESIPKPRKKTLETIAKNTKLVTIEELLESCGYDVETIEDRVKRVESDIEDYMEFVRADGGFGVYSGIEDLGMDVIYNGILSKYEFKINVKDADVPATAKKKGAESGIRLLILWDYGRYECCTGLDIYYIETKGGNIITVAYRLMCPDSVFATAAGKVISSTVVVSKDRKISREERLLNAIFGEDCIKYPSTLVGFGVEIPDIAKGFEAFINTYANIFCSTEENRILYNKAVACYKFMEVFEDYRDKYGHGAGAAAAYVLRTATGRPYAYYGKDSFVDGKDQNACIMVEDEYGEVPQEELAYLAATARIFGADTFGGVHYNTHVEINKQSVIKVSDFYS